MERCARRAVSTLTLAMLCACGESFSGAPADGGSGSAGASGASGAAGAGGTSGGAGAATLVLNEVDYDNPELDIAEFVEIVNVSGTEQRLDGLVLVLVNGAPAASSEYARVELAGKLPPGGFALIATPSVAGDPSALRFALPGPDNQIQNAGAAGDAIGLLSLADARLIDALSYGGSVLGATITGVGTFDFDEGEPNPLVDVGPGSLVRLPDGTDTNDAKSDWQVSENPTPGWGNTP